MLRNKHHRAKKIIDPLCGMMISLNKILSNESKSIFKDKEISFKRLIEWLKSTGDFDQEVERLKKWQKYCDKLNEKNKSNFYKNSIYYSLSLNEKA
ncbi:MAG TPA: hypothetical protein VJ907_05990 [Halanaerobiales bacterium]|nr:hypothetical protein [Halanaerobiales bacterium]